MNRNDQEIINLIENVRKFSVLHDKKKNTPTKTIRHKYGDQ